MLRHSRQMDMINNDAISIQYMAFVSGEVFIAILIVAVAIRTVRGMSGSDYSAKKLFTRPAAYIVLTVLLVFGLALWQDAVLFISVAAGILLGLALGRKGNVFEQDGRVMFKRSLEVTLIWLVAYVIRIGVDFAFNPALTQSSTPSPASIFIAANAFEGSILIFGADLLLSFTAGLLLGEALALRRSYRERIGR